MKYEKTAILYLIMFLLFAIFCILKISDVQQKDLTQQIKLMQQQIQEIQQQMQQLQQEAEKSDQFRDQVELMLQKLKLIENATISYYSPFDNQSGIEGGPITSTGSRPGPGTMAIDPRIIPMGSHIILIYADGTAEMGIAEDTGGAIKGARVDVFRWTYRETVRDGIKAARVIWMN
jgi:3D (Asp-Asp-Asp) domain-containing protein